VQQEVHTESARENGCEGLSKDYVALASRLEIYRWLFWAAVFVIVVLVVAQCAQHR
jgi:hypothetical protein